MLHNVNNVLLTEKVNFPLTYFQVSMDDKKYLNLNLNRPLLIIPFVDKNKNLSPYGVIADIKSFEKNVNSEIFLQVKGVYRVRILRVKDSDIECFPVKENLHLESDLHNRLTVNLIGFMDRSLLSLKPYLNHLAAVNLNNSLFENLEGLRNSYFKGNGYEVLRWMMQIAENTMKDRAMRLRFLSVSIYRKFNLLLLSVERSIQNVVIDVKVQFDLQKKISEQQRNFLINERIHYLRKQLDNDSIKVGDKWKAGPKGFREYFKREFNKLNSLPRNSAEYPLQRKLIDALGSLPWKVRETDFNLEDTRAQLDSSHFGLDTLKEELINYLTAYSLSSGNLNKVICLVGGPGTGKTSIVKNLARAINRDFIKVSLAGCSEGSYLLGTSRTYINSQPGIVVNEMVKIDYCNPIVLLDEIDKTVSRYNSGGSAIEYALLDILDFENNINFKDHFIETVYPLNKVIFIATANSLENIPLPLYDRLSIIKLDPYSLNDRLNIANSWLIPSIKRELKLEDSKFKISNRNIEYIVQNFTFESGVRELKRKIETLILNHYRGKIKGALTEEKIDRIFYSNKIPNDSGLSVRSYVPYPGRSIGLWASQSSIGGTVAIDVNYYYKGDEGDIFKEPRITGSASQVMKESAVQAIMAVANFFKSRKQDDIFRKVVFSEWLIHYNGTAMTKDGPSAGLATALAIISAIIDKPIDDFCITGEINLRGEVQIIGGIPAKIAGVVKNNYSKMIVPLSNKDDFNRLSEYTESKVKVIFVESFNEALDNIWPKYFK